MKGGLTLYDLVIRGANVVTAQGVSPLTVAVQDGVTAALISPHISVEGGQVLDLDGLYLLPGAIDPHSHVTYCDDFFHGTQTAASGGVTTIIEMPLSLTLPAATTPEVFNDRIALGRTESVVYFALWGGIQPDTITQSERLFDLGAASLKVFMNYVGEEYKYFDDYPLLCLMEQVKKCHGLIGVHAENGDICAGLSRRYREMGYGPEHYSRARPILAESEAVERLCLMALQTGCPVHVCHVTAPEVAKTILRARKKGAAITFETCPHYLYLTDQDIAVYGAYAKCNPPMRDKTQQEGLWELLKQGAIDCIGSDHSAYSPAQKEYAPFWDAPGGFPGMDLMLPILISEGVHKRGVHWETIAEVTSGNPARIFGLSHKKGSIQIGKDADFAVIDPHKEWTFHASQCFYGNRSENYPYEGRVFKGQVLATLVRGKTVFQHGKILTPPGYGQYVSSLHGGQQT